MRQAGQYLRELLRRDPYRNRWALVRGPGANATSTRSRWPRCWPTSCTGTTRTRWSTASSLAGCPAHCGARCSAARRCGLFIRAFEIGEEHAAILWRQWQGAELARVVIGELPPLAVPAGGLPSYRTILLHEFHYLGPDGRPLRHRTLRDIRSLVDGLASYRYSYDTSELTVSRVACGTASPPYQRR